ncbi:resolvase [Yersinia pekkanenii]|uniref:Resolvase n=1 Tax=Yersinia pekkanenii TaxID=1288385 RepID=A0ABM9TWD3_9GAMM|nr:resolvase [Yersinia pekkanenii]CRY69835.1 putative resolvase [Yersinia pekkanenii]
MSKITASHYLQQALLERTNDGRVAALAAGVKFGRKIHSRTPAALMLILQGEGVSSVTDKTGISRATYFRLKRKIKNDAKKEHLSQVDSM